MKTRRFLIALVLATAARAADLPTVTVDHLFYLEARAERVRKLNTDEMVEYCLVQKIGGSFFEDLYAQLSNVRRTRATLIGVEDVKDTDSRIITIDKTTLVCSKLLREEVQKIQNGIIREGQIATDALRSIARSQAPQQ